MTEYDLTTMITREGDGFVSLCPELDVASQGDTPDEAQANLVEALELFLECATQGEIERRLQRADVRLGSVRMAVG